MAHLNEQLQQELSRKDQELKETRDAHQSQISSLQEKIASLVSHVGQSQIIGLCVYVNHIFNTDKSLKTLKCLILAL